MTCIIDKQYIQDYESDDSLVSYEIDSVGKNTLRYINGYFYKAYMVCKLWRWNRGAYGFKGKYKIYWSKLNKREMKKACYLDDVGS